MSRDVAAATPEPLDERGRGTVLAHQHVGVEVQRHLADLSRHGEDGPRRAALARLAERLDDPIVPTPTILQLVPTVVAEDANPLGRLQPGRASIGGEPTGGLL